MTTLWPRSMPCLTWHPTPSPLLLCHCHVLRHPLSPPPRVLARLVPPLLALGLCGRVWRPSFPDWVLVPSVYIKCGSMYACIYIHTYIHIHTCVFICMYIYNTYNNNFYINEDDKFVTSVDGMPDLQADAVSSTFVSLSRASAPTVAATAGADTAGASATGAWALRTRLVSIVFWLGVGTECLYTRGSLSLYIYIHIICILLIITFI